MGEVDQDHEMVKDVLFDNNTFKDNLYNILQKRFR